MVCCEQGVALNIIRYEETNGVNILKCEDDVLLPPNEFWIVCCVKMISVKTIVPFLFVLLNDK